MVHSVYQLHPILACEEWETNLEACQYSVSRATTIATHFLYTDDRDQTCGCPLNRDVG